MKSFLKNCFHNWRLCFIIGYPIILLPIPILVNTLAGYAAYSIALVAGLWLTEALPSPVAGMVPVILHPLLGLQSSEQVVQEYLKDTAMVFMGGYLLSLAFEFCGLHKRVAMKVMLWCGSSISTLMLGIMLTTTFLSMWMFNAAAAAMMVPIVFAVLDELKSAGIVQLDSESVEPENEIAMRNRRKSSVSRRFSVAFDADMVMTTPALPVTPNTRTFLRPIVESDDEEIRTVKTKPKPLFTNMQNLRNMFLLGISYSANIGGTGVLTGTGPNLIALDYLGDLDPAIHGDHASLTFTTWMFFAIIPMSINICVAWIYLQLVYMGLPDSFKFWRIKDDARAKATAFILKTRVKGRMQEKYDSLGPFTSHQIAVTIHFLCTATFWALHNPKLIPGWSELFVQKIHISTGTMLTGFLLFVIPRNGSFYSSVLTGKFPKEKLQPLLEWEYAKKGIPWGVFTLLGGGLALSKAAVSSGLSASVVNSLQSLIHLPPYAIQVACLFVVVVLTEMMSNTVVATIAIPIFLQLSLNLHLHPLYLTFPVAIACSYAFILPVATGPNLIVYTASGMKLIEMVKTGIFMSVISILVLCFCSNYYGELLFHFSEYKILQPNSTGLVI